MPVEIKTTRRRRRRHSSAPAALTLREVATAAGVSTASASRALNRPDLVSEALRQQVERAARKLDYVPNAAAQSLSGQPHRLVGVVLGNLEGAGIAGILDALADSLASHNVALLIATGAETPVETAKRVRELVGRGAQAILFGGGAAPVRTALETPANRRPWLALDAANSDQGIENASGFDRSRAQALAIRYLGSLGHRRIALMSRGGERDAKAAREALGEHDILVSPVVAPDNDDAGIRVWLSSRRGLPAAPTALVCESDAVAATAIRACARLGIAVPQDLSIVGFGDSELSRYTQPTLTTIRVPTREAGIAAAGYILAVLHGLPTPTPRLAVKLIARDSSGPVSA